MTCEPEIAAATTSNATWRTLNALLQFARLASDADGYALYELNDGHPSLMLRDGESIAGFDPKHLALAGGRFPLVISS